MSVHKELYVPLLSVSLDGSDESPSECMDPGHPARFARSRRTLHTVVVFACATIISLLVVLSWVYTQYSSLRAYCPESYVYSPADSAIGFKETQFVPDFHSRNIYLQPPSPNVDEAWNKLYMDYIAQQIPKSEAQRMRNQTVAVPADSDHHLVSLMVFHQLHCLNTLRKSMHPEIYLADLMAQFGTKEEIAYHLNHCLDSLRQGVMCTSDISPIVYEWNNKEDRLLGRMDVTQTCRDFGRIQEWADEHRFQGDLTSYFRIVQR